MSDETRRLAQFVVDLHEGELPEAIRERLRSLTLDSLATGVLGAKQPWYVKATEVMYGLGVGGSSRIFGSELQFDPSRATFLRGIAIGGFEATHVGNSAQPGVTVSAPVFALAEAIGASGETVMRALAAGYEVNCRVGVAQTHQAERVRGFHNPAVTGVFGAAAGCSVLLGLSLEQTLWALGIAGSSAAGLVEFVWDGSMTERLHLGRSAQMGLEAALLAQQGITGPPTILEGRCGYLQAYSPEPRVEELVNGLGSRWWLEMLQVKPFPGHAIVQPFIAALGERFGKGSEVASIDKIEVGLTAAERYLDRSPHTVTGAQHSIPYTIAVVLVRGVDGVIDLDESALNDPEIQRFAQLVTFTGDSRSESQVRQTGSYLTVSIGGSEEVIPAPGIPRFTGPELRKVCAGKFARYAKGSDSDARRAAIETLVDRLETVPDVTELANLVFG